MDFTLIEGWGVTKPYACSVLCSNLLRVADPPGCLPQLSLTPPLAGTALTRAGCPLSPVPRGAGPSATTDNEGGFAEATRGHLIPVYMAVQTQLRDTVPASEGEGEVFWGAGGKKFLPGEENM